MQPLLCRLVCSPTYAPQSLHTWTLSPARSPQNKQYSFVTTRSWQAMNDLAYCSVKEPVSGFAAPCCVQCLLKTHLVWVLYAVAYISTTLFWLSSTVVDFSDYTIVFYNAYHQCPLHPLPPISFAVRTLLQTHLPLCRHRFDIQGGKL